MKVRVRTLLATPSSAPARSRWPISMAKPGCTEVEGKDTLVISDRPDRQGHRANLLLPRRGRKKLRFVLARASDGRVHSVMDACSQCYSYHKGFAYSDGYLICRLCGNRYPIDHILEPAKPRACRSRLPSSETDGNVIIRTADLKKNRWLF